MREPFKWHITINLNNGRKPSLWDFLARVPEIFVQRIVWRSKQFKSIFSDFDTLAKNVPSVGAVASLFGFLVSTETSWSLFKKVRENCTVTPKALDPADSLHHTHTYYCLSWLPTWIIDQDQGRKYFWRCQRRKKNVSSNSDWKCSQSKILTSTSAILHSWIILFFVTAM